MATLTTQIKVRNDTSANWESKNPVLAKGEIGYDSTNNKFKIGDGTKKWTELGYTSASVSNWLKLKNASGADVSYNGSSNVDLTDGIYYATKANYPNGFSAGVNNFTWGTLGNANNGFTKITGWQIYGGEIDYATKSNQLFVQIDGKFYQNEGRYEVIDSGTDQTVGGDKTFTGTNTFNKASGFNYSAIENASSDATRNVWFSHGANRGTPVYNDNFKYNPSTNKMFVGNIQMDGVLDLNNTGSIKSNKTVNIVTAGNTNLTHNSSVVWTAANDGAGSGLDADLLDGKHASDFAASADLSKKVDKQTILSSGVDLNTVLTSGFYRISSQSKDLVNTPSGSDLGFGQMLVISGGGDTISQLAMPYNSARIYVRNGNVINNSSGTWRGWATVANTSDIGNGKIIINQNGSKKGEFTVNQSGDTTINLTDTNTDTNTTYSAGSGISISGSDNSISVNTGYTTNGQNYAVSVDSSTNKLYVNVPWNNTTYQAGTGLSLSGTKFNANTGFTSSGRNYGVKTDSSNNLYVNVPWTDTKYSAGTGLSLSSSNVFSHSNAVTAKSSGLYKFSYDAQGHITGSTNVTTSDITGLDIPSNSALSNYVTLNTEQYISGFKHFKNGLCIQNTGSDSDEWVIDRSGGLRFCLKEGSSYKDRFFLSEGGGDLSLYGDLFMYSPTASIKTPNLATDSIRKYNAEYIAFSSQTLFQSPITTTRIYVDNTTEAGTYSPADGSFPGLSSVTLKGAIATPGGIHAAKKIISDKGFEGGYGDFTSKLSGAESQLRVKSTNNEASILYQGTGSTWIVGTGCDSKPSKFVWYNNGTQLSVDTSNLNTKNIIPMSDNTYNLGAGSSYFKDAYIANQYTDRMYVNHLRGRESTIAYTQTLYPESSNSYSLGSSTYYWSSIYSNYNYSYYNYPRSGDGTGSLGTSSRKWSSGYINYLYSNSIQPNNNSTTFQIQGSANTYTYTQMHNTRIRIVSWYGNLSTSWQNIWAMPAYSVVTVHIIANNGKYGIFQLASTGTTINYWKNNIGCRVSGSYMQANTDSGSSSVVIFIIGAHR